MYYDSRNERLLLKDGQSVTSDFDYAIGILTGTNKGMVRPTEDADIYELFYNEYISADIDSEDPLPSFQEHSAEDLDFIIEKITTSPRFADEHETVERINKELEFFERTGNIVFLIRLGEVIEYFKENGIVWGVGRGSSCSSYVLYLLEVNDINPLEYNISFSELSKEQEEDD